MCIRDIGKHPESGKMISAGLGRYGPFLLHDGGYANLETVEDVFTIGLNRAVTVIAERKAKGPARGRTATAALKELGEHPDGGAITVRDGRYGPYVNWGKVNATLPKDLDPQAVTLEKALELVAERAGKSGKKAAPKKAAAKKAAPAKKPAAAKKAAPKKKAAAAKTSTEKTSSAKSKEA